jgi:hypothetical protein
MERVDRQAKLSDRLGINMQATQKLALAANLAGTDMEVLQKAMLHMGKTIGSGGMPLDKRLFQVATAVSKIRDPAKRNASIEKIFGRQGREAINLLIQGGPAILKSAEAIDRFGLGISRIDAVAVERANDALTVLSTVTSGMWDRLSVEVAPAIEAFATFTLEVLALGKALNETLPGLVGGRAFGGKTFLDMIFAAGPQSGIIAWILARNAKNGGGGPGGFSGGADSLFKGARPHAGAHAAGSVEAARLIQQTGSRFQTQDQIVRRLLQDIALNTKGGVILGQAAIP